MFNEVLDILVEDDTTEQDMHQKWICFDFDGVCASYENGWQGADTVGNPIEGMVELVNELHDAGYKCLLFTTRPVNDTVMTFLDENGFNFDAINSCEHNPPDSEKKKPIAELYIDDRGVRFDENDPSRSIADVKELLGI